MKAQCPRCKTTMKVVQGESDRDETCTGCGATLVVPGERVAKPGSEIDEAILGMASDIREIRNLIAAVLVLVLIGVIAVVGLRMMRLL